MPTFTEYFTQVDDWDVYGTYDLSVAQYVSSPTSLHESINGLVTALYKGTGATVIPQGEVSAHFYTRHQPAKDPRIYFRNQTPVGDSEVAKYYIVEFTSGEAQARSYFIGGGGVEVLGAWGYILPSSQWAEVKVKWYVPTTGAYQNQLAIELYSKSGGVWVKEEADGGGYVVYDDANLYNASAINRVGVRIGYQSYVDDVVILAGYSGQYPSDDVARVSSIRHIFQPGLNVMQVGLGDLGFDTDVAEAAIRKIVAAELETGKLPEGPSRLPWEPKEYICPDGEVFYSYMAYFTHMAAWHPGVPVLPE